MCPIIQIGPITFTGYWLMTVFGLIFSISYVFHHWQQCANCNDVKNEAGHVYSEDWYFDESHHYHKCECGAKADEMPHNHQAGNWESNETEHWHVCEQCNREISNTRAIHEYDNDSDTECNICGHSRTIPPIV